MPCSTKNEPPARLKLLDRFADSPDFETVLDVAREVREAGGSTLLVGGCVRDVLLGVVPKDLDLEVRGLDPDELLALLARKRKVDEYGKSFGILKIRHTQVEVSLPRTERKTGSGHKGFTVEVDPHLPFPQASARRDFTMNAMALDPLTGVLPDPHGGQADLDARILRHVGHAFSEDPLRVLRGMQFAARFHLSPAEETLALCQTIEPQGLPAERLFEEWKKLLLLGETPSVGMRFLKEAGWLKHYPELHALVGCEQDREWHPEGDVWVHTLHCLDAFAKDRIGDDWEDLVVGFAVLCHDLGKPATSFCDENGRIRSPRHETEGEAPSRAFLARLTKQKDLVEQVVPLVRRHLAPRVFYEERVGDAAIRRLARQVVRLDRLVRVAAADVAGRPPKPLDFPEGPWLLERAEALHVKDAAPVPLVLGRHLVERGLRPGPTFKPLLDACFESQLDGIFTDLQGGLRHLDALLAAPPNAE